MVYICNKQIEGSDTWLLQTSPQHIHQQLASDHSHNEPSAQALQYSDLQKDEKNITLLYTICIKKILYIVFFFLSLLSYDETFPSLLLGADNDLVNLAQWLTKWHHEYGYDVNHILWLSHSLPLLNEQIWEILDGCITLASASPQTKFVKMFGGIMFIIQAESTEAFLVASGGPTPY